MMCKVVFALLSLLGSLTILKATNPQAELNAFFYDKTYVLDTTSDDLKILETNEAQLITSKNVLITNAFNVNQTDSEPWQKLFQIRIKDSKVNTHALAEQVAKLVKERGPFLSLSHFVNGNLEGTGEGIIQQALDVIGVNPPGLQRLAPGNITQADILRDIEQVLVTRDDTFIVKSYGDVVNPHTGAIEARAWCTAVVQRMPDVYDEERQEWGRRFEVVRFEWD